MARKGWLIPVVLASLFLAVPVLASTITIQSLGSPGVCGDSEPQVLEALGFSPDGRTVAGNLYPKGRNCNRNEGRYWVIGPDENGIWRQESKGSGRFRANLDANDFKANSASLPNRKDAEFKEFQSEIVGKWKKPGRFDFHPVLWRAPGVTGSTNEAGVVDLATGKEDVGELFGQSAYDQYFGTKNGDAVALRENGNIDLNFPTFPGKYTGNEFGAGFFVGDYEEFLFYCDSRKGYRKFYSAFSLGVYVGGLGNEPILLDGGGVSQKFMDEDYSGNQCGGKWGDDPDRQKAFFMQSGAAAHAADIASFDLPLSTKFLDNYSAIAVGQRMDGKPGAWAIQRDGKVANPRKTGAGDRTSNIGGIRQAPMEHWTYEAKAVSSDGKIIVGTATAESGFEYRPGKSPNCPVEAGTSIGVFWQVSEFLQKPWIKDAQVIGSVNDCRGKILGISEGLIKANDVFLIRKTGYM
ncbi:MAG: hypothetical protein ACLFRG_10165 [Desulfococcaceae bacterium]